MAQIGEKAVKGFRWMAAGRLAGQAVTWVVTIFVIRILSPEDYGLLAMAMVVIGFLALFDTLGMGSALIQKETFDRTEVRQVFGLVILINVFAFCLLQAIAPLVAAFFDEPRLVAIIRVAALQFPIMALQIVPDAIIRRRMLFRPKSFVNFATMVLGSFFTLGLAIRGYGVWALVLGSLFAVTTRVIGYNLIGRYFCLPSFSFSGLRKIVTFGSQVTGERLLWFIHSQADIFLIGRVLGKELLGYYSVAIHLASLPMTKLAEIVNEVSLSAFSRIQSDLAEVRRQFLKVTLAIGFFAFPVFLGISATAPEIVGVILGETWRPAAAPLQILSLVIPLRMLHLVIPTALMGIGRADLSVSNGVIATVILPVAFAIGLRWGIVGVCYAWLVGYTVYFGIALARSLPVLGTGMIEYIRTIAPVTAISIVMLLVVHASRPPVEDMLGSGFLSLISLIAIGVAVFALLTLVFNREAAFFALRLIRR